MTQEKTIIGVWRAPKKDRNGNNYYTGKIDSDAWVAVFKNNSDNPKAPFLNIVIPEGYKITKIEKSPEQILEEATTNNAADDDIPF